MFAERLTPKRAFASMGFERMYVIHPRQLPQTGQTGQVGTDRGFARRRRLADTLLWRARWAALALGAVLLLGLGYAREAAVSPLVAGRAPVASETVTVAEGDTLWGIASRRYPGADVRQKVFEIEQLNDLSGPTIVTGQRLRVPAR
jgi:LysM repeat protein